MPKQRVLIFIVAYNAEKTIEQVIGRIPRELADSFDVEILIIDDGSKDRTFERGEAARQADMAAFKLHVLFNPVNQGYGGNQKIGFHFAIREGFDFVALVHGDGQYAPECLPDLLAPLSRGDADAVFGSRMLTRDGALKGGMPLYKFVGNRILTWIQNHLLDARLSEFHSGFRLYSVAALRRIPFQLNSQRFPFDTEIIIQLIFARQRIIELPIPTYYGDEICHVNGLGYAWDVVKQSVIARMQAMNLFYDRKYDCTPEAGNDGYRGKLGFDSPHQAAIDAVPAGARVLDLGCAGGYVGSALRAKGCHVAGIDLFPLAPGIELDSFQIANLNDGLPPVDLTRFDYVLLLDVIEHLNEPERFIDRLRDAAKLAPDLKLILSTGNVAFVVTRLMLLFGQMNYGKRGILDMTHTRLFTTTTIARLLTQAGFDVLEARGIPVPFPLAVGEGRLARLLLWLNRLAIRVSSRLFAFQIFLVAQPRPSLEYLLAVAHAESEIRAGNLKRDAA